MANDEGPSTPEGESNQQSPVANPLVGAITYGFSCAATVAIGAAIRKNSVHKEAMTVMFGGLVCGGIAGFVGLLLSVRSPTLFKVFDGLLQFGAIFSLPAMGNVIRPYHGYKYTEIIIDMFVGGCVTGGGICCCVFMVFFVFGICFGGKRDAADVLISEQEAYTITSAVPADDSPQNAAVDPTEVTVTVGDDLETGISETPIAVASRIS